MARYKFYIVLYCIVDGSYYDINNDSNNTISIGI